MTDLIYKLNKSKSDIEQLLQAHRNLIYYMLGQCGQLHNQDAESAGWEALWDAISLFDVFSDVQFSAFACAVIKNAIYNVLRQQAKYDIEITLNEEIHCCYDKTGEQDTHTIVQNIENIFKNYVSTKNGKARDVLLTWYGASFEIPVKEIASICRCSSSYVSRVQQGFRAFLSGKLRGR